MSDHPTHPSLCKLKLQIVNWIGFTTFRKYFCTGFVTLQTRLYSTVYTFTVQLRLSINNCSHMDSSGLWPHFGKINIKCMGKLWDCRMKTPVFAATEIVVTLNKFSFN